MKNDLSYLPEKKQRELAAVVEVLHEEFDVWAQSVKPRGGKSAGGRILKIILFGSYARGDWVDDPVGGYRSDYDLLVIVDKDYVADTPGLWMAAEDRFFRERRFKTPVQILTHTLGEVNDFLGRGRYFFTDIVKEGVVLYELKGHKLRRPEPLTPEQAYEEAKDYYEEWMRTAVGFLFFYQAGMVEKLHKLSAFQLHQATENLYKCLLLVLTNYAPDTHNLNHLRSMAESRDERLRAIWSSETRFHKRCYELLRQAYVKARFSKHYKITEEELAWLSERVQLLREAVETVCEEQLSALQAATSTPSP